jgi:UDP-N-acetylmuramate dehydrogenase
MSSVVVSIDLVTPDGDTRMSNADLAFQYRSSILKREHRPCLVTGLSMRFAAADPAGIEARMAEFNDHRKSTQPPGATIGSMFKNPPGDYAGRLIEAAGLKGKHIGGAEISQKHANFFLNADGASASDVKALIDLARWEVWKRFGVELELEIELVGTW